MKDKKKNRLWSGDFKLRVDLDIIENELSYSQAARKYVMYLSSGSLNDTLPARWVYQYRLYGKERFFQTPKDYRKNPVRQFQEMDLIFAMSFYQDIFLLVSPGYKTKEGVSHHLSRL